MRGSHNLIGEFFLGGRGKDSRELEGVSYPYKPLIFSSLKLGVIRSGRGGEWFYLF